MSDEPKLNSIRQVIVRNSIIDGGNLEDQRYSIAVFPTVSNSEFPLPNINDTGDEVIDPNIDHKLRNHGLMKSARQHLNPDETYYVRFKSVLDSDKKELYMDYMEWCPKEIYDNPETPEDVW